MPDIVSESLIILQAALETVPAIAGKTAYLYTQEEFLDEKKKLGLPAVAILYIGLLPKEDNRSTDIIAEIVFDVVLIGKDNCGPDDIKSDTTQLLDAMRTAIRTPAAPDYRRWNFMFERPIELGRKDEDLLAYVQRYGAAVTLDE